MINFRVIRVNDLFKFFLKLIVFIFIIWTFFIALKRFRKMNLTDSIKGKFKGLENKTFIECINENLGVISEEADSKSVNIISEELSLVSFDCIINEPEYSVEDDELVEENVFEDNVINSDDCSTEVIEENNKPDSYTDSYGSVLIKNGTEIELTDDMLVPDVSFDNKNDIIIFHTHTCESYTPSEKYNYEQTGNFRTTDLDYSVARVGEELTGLLRDKGFNVVHDITYHDYPEYIGSYSRSLETVQNIENDTPAELVIDLHRDALGDSSYGPKVRIGNEYAAQLMFVMGSNEGGLYHPNWNDNLKFAIKIQEKANEKYPGLFKPIMLTKYRYNQSVAKGACIIEVGATGNTLDECLNSMKYLAEVIGEVMG